MQLIDEKTRRFVANGIFPSFCYAVLGLVLTQAGAVQLHGSWGLHVFLGLPGLVLSGLTLYRARLHWPVAGAGIRVLHVRALGWYLVLFAAGVSVGVLISLRSVLLVGMVPSLTYLLPWAKSPACRAQFVVSSASMLAGAIAWMVLQGRAADPLYLMIAGWMLCAPPMLMHFIVLTSLDRGYRIDQRDVNGRSDLDAPVSLLQ